MKNHPLQQAHYLRKSHVILQQNCHALLESIILSSTRFN